MPLRVVSHLSVNAALREPLIRERLVLLKDLVRPAGFEPMTSLVGSLKCRCLDSRVFHVYSSDAIPTGTSCSGVDCSLIVHCGGAPIEVLVRLWLLKIPIWLRPLMLPPEGIAYAVMAVLRSFLQTLRVSFRSRAALQPEILALRRQLQVLERVRLRRSYGLLWCGFANLAAVAQRRLSSSNPDKDLASAVLKGLFPDTRRDHEASCLICA